MENIINIKGLSSSQSPQALCVISALVKEEFNIKDSESFTLRFSDGKLIHVEPENLDLDD